MSHDPKCYELAEYFLPRNAPELAKSELAQAIQETVETFLKYDLPEIEEADKDGQP
jgi:hypothetical protein